MMSLKSPKYLFTHLSNAGGPLDKPKGMRIQSYNTQGVVEGVMDYIAFPYNFS